jgi:peptidoglycan-N-acetylglucosamine deacetylase
VLPNWLLRKLFYFIVTLVAFLSIVVFALWRVANLRTFQFFGEIVPRVETSEKAVALTFDGGSR